MPIDPWVGEQGMSINTWIDKASLYDKKNPSQGQVSLQQHTSIKSVGH